ncbi:farnesol dehydrogenase-like [Anopheles cruzii]|uniref:farnesol dehydrogenase-like n=1 Tax=Anopheles cruzii TaxID=68878 RepID=UPI0022EC9524|nr:farnesol dehydrogenase-like [Anopheles cruzii]
MNRWIGKVAVVTGASSGIGAATAKALANAGMITVGLARRVDRIDELKAGLPVEAASRLHSLWCDVTKENDILEAFSHIEQRFGGVDVLINSAGVARSSTGLLDSNNTQTLRDVVDTNLMGLMMCSREAFQSMKKRSVDGHIVHINSVLGHKVFPMQGLNAYAATKFGVTALAETMRNELRSVGNKTKVTCVSPGFVRTKILPKGMDLSSVLEPEDVAEAILYVVGTPPKVQIEDITFQSVTAPL